MLNVEDETGQATGYRASGSISVAADDQRWEEILRGASMAKTFGVDTEVIGLDHVSIEFAEGDFVCLSAPSGGGKTTLLNTLAALIPRDQRVVTIEDAAELRLQQPHVARMETRQASLEGCV